MSLIQLPDPFFNIMKALGQGGENFIQNKRIVDDRQRAEEDRLRQQKMQDLQTFISLMPYMQGATSTGPNGEVLPATFSPPEKIASVVQDLTGQANPLFGPSPDMILKTAQAKVAGSTVGDQITQSKNATESSGLTVQGQKQGITKNQYDIDTSVVKDKQTYIAKEAPNYVSAVVTEQTPPTDKNRQTLIDSAYKNFVATAPDTPYKKSVRRDDFAGAVDALIAEEKKLGLERARVNAYARQVSTSGVPDYMRAASEIRMNIKNRLDELKGDKDLMNVVSMFEANPEGQNDPKNQAIIQTYGPKVQEYQRLLRASNGLMSVQTDIMVNGGVPSKKGIEMLSRAMDEAQGLSSGGGSAGGGGGMSSAIQTFADALRNMPSVAVEARIAAAKKQNLLSEEEERQVRSLLRGGKK